MTSLISPRLLAGFLLAGGTLVAQDPEITPPPDGMPTEIHQVDGAAVTWLGTYDAIPVYRDPECTVEADDSLAYRSEWNELWRNDQVVLLGEEHPDTPKAVGRVIGYAKQNDLLGSRGRAYRCLRTPTGVQRKAIVVHKWEKGSETEEAAILRSQPHDFAPETTRLRLYEILFVYAVRGEDPEDPSAGYSLVGRRPYRLAEVDDSDVIQGWIPNRRIFFWDHREAWEYNKEPEALRARAQAADPIRMYLDEGDVENAVPAFEEDLGQGPWNYYQQRFPIVDHRPVEINGTDHYRIGVIGDSYAGGEVVTSKDVEDAVRLHLEELRSGIQNLDVLLVLDATGSMSKFYKSIHDSVRRIQKSIELATEQPIRYAVLYYRDYTEENDADSWSTYFRDFMPSDQFAELFREGSPDFVDSRGGDDNPPPFFALDTAVRSVTWHPGSMRAVILIGDMGNEEPDSRDYTLDQVGETLRENACSFFAIQAHPQANHSRVTQFNDQAGRVADRLQMPVREVLAADGNDLSSALLSNINASLEHIRLLEDVLQRLQTGEGLGDAVFDALNESGLGHLLDAEGGASMKGERTGTFITHRVREMLRSKGHDPDLFASARIQHFGYALAPLHPDGAEHPWFRTRVLMSLAECQSLAGSVLGRLQRSPLTNQNVGNVWRGIVNVLSGDFDDAITFDEDTPLSRYVTMALGIPIRSQYLKMSVRELKNLEPRELANWQEEIDRHYQMLTHFINDKKIDGSGSERHFFPMHGVDYAWVPLEILP